MNVFGFPQSGGMYTRMTAINDAYATFNQTNTRPKQKVQRHDLPAAWQRGPRAVGGGSPVRFLHLSPFMYTILYVRRAPLLAPGFAHAFRPLTVVCPCSLLAATHTPPDIHLH